MDNEDQPEVSLSEQLRGRRAAERALHQRDAVEGRLTGRTRARLPGALLAGALSSSDAGAVCFRVTGNISDQPLHWVMLKAGCTALLQ